MKISNNYICASACFFIHIAGVDRQGTLLGIHRPYVSPEVTKKRGLNDTFSDYKKIKKLVTAYLDKMGVSQTYFERMQRVSSSEMLLLQMTEVEQNFIGKIPELEEWEVAKCGALPPTDKVWVSNHWGKMQRGLLTPDEKIKFDNLSAKRSKHIDCAADKRINATIAAYHTWLKEEEKTGN